MDQELKASMENILRMSAPKQNQGSTTTSRPSFQRPSEDEINKKVEKRTEERLSGYIPARLLCAEIRNCEYKYNGFESLFITGPAGTGKSYLAASVLKERIRDGARRYLNELYAGKEEYGPDFTLERGGWSWLWTSVPELLLELRGSFKERAQETESEIINDYSSPDALILDDLGAEKSSDFTIQSLYLIIDRRYSSMRPTIITSNLSLGQISEKVGDRIASRIAGMCKVIELKGKDRRIG